VLAATQVNAEQSSKQASAGAFEYTSGTPLTTLLGVMSGSYQMENEHGDSLDIEIPAFSLDSPYHQRG